MYSNHFEISFFQVFQVVTMRIMDRIGLLQTPAAGTDINTCSENNAAET